MWYALLPIMWPVIAALDAIILVPLPAILILNQKPGLAVITCIATATFLVADHLINFDGIAYPVRLLGVPTETLPVSIVVLIVTGVIATRKWAKRS